jgi:selenocysteine lyase/cysteine desulfurase
MIENQRHLFDIPEGITYLNCAYLSPPLSRTAQAGIEGIGRKVHPWTIVRRDFFADLEEVRGLFARLVGTSADDIAIVPASSYAAALAGANLPLGKGQTVIVIEGEHFSNVYQWKLRCQQVGAQLITVPAPLQTDWTQGILERINANTAIVAIPHYHWHDGRLVDLNAVAAAARKVGAALVIDGTQSIGAAPLDLAAVKPAFLFCSAYKWLLGPYGLAFLYVDPAYHSGRPLEHHAYNRAGAADMPSSSGYADEFMAGARRYDFGERSNFINLPMIKASLAQLLEWGGPAEIQRSLAPFVAQINEEGVRCGLAASPKGSGAAHFTGLRVPGGIPKGLQDALAAEGVYISVRDECLRISPYLYNSMDDVARLFEVLVPKLPTRH